MRYEWDNNPASGKYCLRIRDASNYDEGTYRCVASNTFGSATTKSYVKINDGNLLAKSQKPSSDVPRLALKLSDVRVMEGQPLRLECKVEGNPLPELVWYKDGEKIIPSERIQLEQDPDGKARLIIPKCTLDDDGEKKLFL